MRLNCWSGHYRSTMEREFTYLWADLISREFFRIKRNWYTSHSIHRQNISDSIIYHVALSLKRFVFVFRCSLKRTKTGDGTRLINLDNRRRKSWSFCSRVHHNERHEFEKQWNGAGNRWRCNGRREEEKEKLFCALCIIAHFMVITYLLLC